MLRASGVSDLRISAAGTRIENLASRVQGFTGSSSGAVTAALMCTDKRLKGKKH